MGVDPALALFATCDSPLPVAANDDDIGLDATARIKLHRHEPIFIHLVNAAAMGGTIDVTATSDDGYVSGTVTDAASGLPIPNAQVYLDYASGSYSNWAVTAVDGSYAISASVGTYYVHAFAPQYVSEVYPNGRCAFTQNYLTLDGCDLNSAQTVTIDGSTNATAINFMLDRGLTISGTVDDANNHPIGATVSVLDTTGTFLANTQTDSDGNYSFEALTPGDYKLVAESYAYGSQMYDHVACNGPLQQTCDYSAAGTLSLATADETIDFSLPILASVSGTVLDRALQPLHASNIEVTFVDEVGNIIADAIANSDGSYSAGPFPSGNFYAFASANGFFSQIANNVDCSENCLTSIPDATPIVVTQTGQVSTANFRLDPLPDLQGHVTDAITGLPLSGVQLLAGRGPPSNFDSVVNAVTDANGNYLLPQIPPGSFYLWAQSPNHIDQIYPAIACEANGYGGYNAKTLCDVSDAVLVQIKPNQSPGNFNYALLPSGRITGRVTLSADVATDLPTSATIIVQDGTGNPIASAATDAFGNYSVNDLAPGPYFAMASDYPYDDFDFISQIWRGQNCNRSCFPTTGTPINVGQAAVSEGIDFSITRRDQIVGRVTDTDGNPISGVVIDEFDIDDLSQRRSEATDSQGFYAISGTMGNAYALATDSGGEWINQVYFNIACPAGPAYYGLCSLDDATPVPLSSSSVQPRVVNFVLKINESIFSNGFELP